MEKRHGPRDIVEPRQREVKQGGQRRRRYRGKANGSNLPHRQEVVEASAEMKGQKHQSAHAPANQPINGGRGYPVAGEHVGIAKRHRRQRGERDAQEVPRVEKPPDGHIGCGPMRRHRLNRASRGAALPTKQVRAVVKPSFPMRIGIRAPSSAYKGETPLSKDFNLAK